MESWQVEILRDWAKSDPNIRRLHLFGSRFRGDNSTESDLDIAVEVFDKPEPDTRIWNAWRPTQKSELENRLSSAIGLKVQLEYLDPREKSVTPVIKLAVQNGSKIIFEAGTSFQ